MASVVIQLKALLRRRREHRSSDIEWYESRLPVSRLEIYSNPVDILAFC